jgi:WD40 repeat protein
LLDFVHRLVWQNGVGLSVFASAQEHVVNCRAYVFVAAICVALASVSTAAPFVAPRDPQCVAFSPSGTLVALAYSGLSNGEFPPRPHPDVRKCGCVQIHDVVTGKRLRRIETYGDFVNLRFSPDGRYLAAARLFATPDGLELPEVRVWTVADGKLAHAFDRCHGFAFSPDKASIVVLGRKKCVAFDLTSGGRLTSYDELSEALATEFVSASRIVGIQRTEEATPRYSLRLIDRATGKRLTASPPLDEPFYHVAVSSDGNLLATGHSAGLVLMWDAAELKPIAKLEMATRGIAHPFFAPDGEVLAAGDQATGDVVMWSLARGDELYRYTFEKGGFRPHYARAASVRERPERDPARFAFSPDGKAFLVGCYGGIVRLVSTGQDVQRFGE